MAASRPSISRYSFPARLIVRIHSVPTLLISRSPVSHLSGFPVTLCLIGNYVTLFGNYAPYLEITRVIWKNRALFGNKVTFPPKT